MADAVGSNVREFIKSIVERVERLQEEKKGIGDDIADLYKEARGQGVNVRALRVVVRLRGQDRAERRELQEAVDQYMRALGEEI